MDARIDLTPGRDFRKSRGKRPFFGGAKRFPWSMEPLVPGELEDSRHELVVTGDKEARRTKREVTAQDLGERCDCCGRDLTIIPWQRYYCLCTNCADILDNSIHNPLYNHGKYPWSGHAANYMTPDWLIEEMRPLGDIERWLNA